MQQVRSASPKAASKRFFPGLKNLSVEAGPGLLLCAAVAIPSWELSRFFPSVDALAFSLILGMILRNVLGPQTSVQPGVRLASAVFVPLGIISYGTRLNFGIFSRLPVYTSILVITSMLAFFLVIMLLSRLLKLDRRTGILIACGTAICGASAIAVLSPVVRARSRDTSIALIVTTTAGLTGIFLYPLIGDWLSLSQTAYGLLSGSTLQQMGVVKLAAAHLGDDAVAYATAVKMVRISMLAPVAIMLAGMFCLKSSSGRSTPSSVLLIALRRAWFIPLFLGTAVIFSFVDVAASSRQFFEPMGNILLAMALASIGLCVDFDSIKDSGSSPLVAGFAGWMAVTFLFIMVLLPLFS